MLAGAGFSRDARQRHRGRKPSIQGAGKFRISAFAGMTQVTVHYKTWLAQF